MSDYSKVKVNLFGPIGIGTGYTNHTRGLAEGLNAIGVDITLVPDTLRQDVLSKLPDLVPLIQKMGTMDINGPTVGIGYGTAFDLFRFAGKPRVAISTIEVNKLPEDWPRNFNQMDAVWVPSTYNKKVFEESGVTKPVSVVKEGINADLYNPFHKKFEVLEKDKRFKFLAVGKLENRKGYDILLKAWTKAFKPEEKDKVALFTLWHNPFAQLDYSRFLYSLHLPAHIEPIELEPIPNDAMMAQLYNSVDAFVWGTRAEGFGRPLLEAMACGTPAISPVHTGIADFFDSSVGTEVKVNGWEQAKDPMFGGTINQGEWAEPSVDSLAEQLRNVYENYEEAKKKAALARRRVEEAWTWEHAAKDFVAELQKVTG
jgi:glycosyltransferase involved in cell wall biosynthesis